MELMRRQRGQVLIALFIGSLLVGGSAAGMRVLFDPDSTASLKKNLESQIADKDRLRRLDAVLDRLHDEGVKMQDDRERHGKALLALIQRHDATTAEFDTLLAGADADDAGSTRHLLDLRFELRQALTSEEWEKLFAKR
ncbi:MAG TPA: hypothetical protein VHB46_02045 [Burkholderiales bacterium]|nr:hypothetical protein [Burkholderiales bacterium]